jgi:UDP-glucose 4-epimerase
VFSSTAAVYGEGQDAPMQESAPTRPASPYGRSKLMDEWVLEDLAAASGLRCVILRYFNVAGADPKGRMGQRTPRATHLIKVACEAALGRRAELPVYGSDYPTRDGTCIRDYIHVEDLAAAHLSALAHLDGGGPSARFNCGYGRGFTVLEVLAALERVAHCKLPIRMVGRRPGDVASVVADVTRIRTMLAWKPAYDDLDVMVRTAYDWERHLEAQRR